MRIAKLNGCTALIDVDRKQESLNRNKNIQRRHFPQFISFLLSPVSDNTLNIFLIGKTAFDKIRSSKCDVRNTKGITNMMDKYFIKHLLDDTRHRARLLLKMDIGSLLVSVNHALCRFRTT